MCRGHTCLAATRLNTVLVEQSVQRGPCHGALPHLLKHCRECGRGSSRHIRRASRPLLGLRLHPPSEVLSCARPSCRLLRLRQVELLLELVRAVVAAQKSARDLAKELVDVIGELIGHAVKLELRERLAVDVHVRRWVAHVFEDFGMGVDQFVRSLRTRRARVRPGSAIKRSGPHGLILHQPTKAEPGVETSADLRQDGLHRVGSGGAHVRTPRGSLLVEDMNAPGEVRGSLDPSLSLLWN